MAFDDNTPTHGRTGDGLPGMGWFVDYGDRVVLTDGRDTWSLEYVSIMQGGFGFSEEGFSKLPRPRKYDSNGKIVIEGDQVVILFRGNNVDYPIVVPGVRAITANDFLPYNHDSVEANPNQMRLRLRAIDADGNPLGRFDVRIGEEDDGWVDLRSTHGFVLRVGDNPDTAPRLAMQMTKDKFYIEKGGDMEPPMLGTSFLTDLQAVLVEVVAVGAAALVPTPDTSAMILKVTAALAAGPPYLSTTIETE